MRKSKFSDSQIMAMIKQNEAGVSVPDLYLELMCLFSAKTKIACCR